MGDVSDDAQNKVVDGEAFEDTEFGRLARELSRTCSEVALWWGDDWTDLPVFERADEFVSDIGKQLAEPIGDVYSLFRRST
jgi:hypothetical protein